MDQFEKASKGGNALKKMNICIFAVAVFMLVQAGVSEAQFQYDNQVGLYTTGDGLGATGTSVMAEPVSVYLVLTRPRDAENGFVPFDHCRGFELSLFFNPMPVSDLFLLNYILPPENVDIGENKDISLGYLDFVVGISASSPVPVINDAVQLAELVFLNFNPGQTAVSLGPYRLVNSIPGEMAYLGNNAEDLRVMHSKGGSHEAPVFIFNGTAVPVENESFGSVKALYR